MSLLLKILQGPNTGAEIALVEGVAITLGKQDDCDIILADKTLPEKPIKISVAASGATIDGEKIEAFQVVEFGATAFAVGPADSPWGKLVWPKKEQEKEEEKKKPEAKAPAPSPKPEEEKAPRRKGCLFKVVVILLFLILIAVICWFFRSKILEYSGSARPRIEKSYAYIKENWNSRFGKQPAGEELQAEPQAEAPLSIVERYNLKMVNRDGRVIYVGNFTHRAERLAATAESYAQQPGIELDFADEESLKAAIADTLSLIGETELKVAGVKNRDAVLEGKAKDIIATLNAIRADVKKIENIDVENVQADIPQMLAENPQAKVAEKAQGAKVALAAGEKATRKAITLPVCGILTTPYPCLVLRNGARVMEGAQIGDYVVEKIEIDTITLTGEGGTFTWKP